MIGEIYVFNPMKKLSHAPTVLVYAFIVESLIKRRQRQPSMPRLSMAQQGDCTKRTLYC